MGFHKDAYDQSFWNIVHGYKKCKFVFAKKRLTRVFYLTCTNILFNHRGHVSPKYRRRDLFLLSGSFLFPGDR